MKNKKIAILGLGYVGLPLAIEFAKKYRVIGFDINGERVSELANGIDKTKEANEMELRTVVENTSDIKGINFTSQLEDIDPATSISLRFQHLLVYISHQILALC